MPSKYYPLRGGLNLSASPLDVYPGMIRESLNYQASSEGGYERIGGYERYDGKASPSEDTYYTAHFDKWDTHITGIAAGDNITVGALTMHVLAIDTSTADTLIAYVCQLVGTIPENLDTTPIAWDAVSSLTQLIPRAAELEIADEFYLEATWDYTRGLIGEVPGDSALISGIIQIEDKVVAFRNNAGLPTVYYSTATGWVAGKIGRVAEVTGYTAESILPGETINAGTHEVAAVCAWYDSAGITVATKAWLVLIPLTALLAPPTGVTTASGGATCTIASVIQPISTFGDYIEYQNYNFLSHPESLSAWIVDGKNLPMCYSASHNVLLPVAPNFNDLVGQKATTIAAHKATLKYSTGAGTFVSSEPGLPFNYAGEYGASQQGVGEIINAMVVADSEHLLVYSQKAAHRLSGSSNVDFLFQPAASNVGSFIHGVQRMDDLYSFSVRGVSSLARSDVQGGYMGGSVSTHIQEYITANALTLACSTAMPSKEQVRWYFGNSEFLMMTRLPSEEGGFYFSFTVGEYPTRPVRGICTEAWSDGRERTFFVSDTGYVYEAEVGSNFDGEAIYSSIELHSNHLGSPALNKGMKYLYVEAQSRTAVTLQASFHINYGEKVFDARNLEVFGGRYVYDTAIYDVARYFSTDRSRVRLSLKGVGSTVAFKFTETSKFSLPYKITGYTIDYSNLGKARK